MERDSRKLSELSELIKSCLEDNLEQSYWIVAELMDVRVNANGHCYLELVEKDDKSDRLTAKASGVIWAQRFRMLKSLFESETGQPFASGMKVLVNVSVNFHALYGFSLVIQDLDPSFTLGEVIRKRNEIVRQLKEDGIFELNKELPIPLLPQRIAVISSATAAGYGDFCAHLREDKGGFVYYIKLFPAIMQGTQTESSVIDALNKIYAQIHLFDVVVIIRGGGATSDLSWFDSYDLCANIAQFPLPVISGIGHERDESVLDMVANMRVKTPTAAAEFLLQRFYAEDERIKELRDTLILLANEQRQQEKERLDHCSIRLPQIARLVTENAINNQKMRIRQLDTVTKLYLMKEMHRCDLKQEQLKWLSPEGLLKRGYTLTLMNGKIITSPEQVHSGDRITTRFSSGEINSIIE
ncbi:MAG: exodeoxyribonuclease VII large subunit [Bacteroidales bacterium]|nr:exodeoxyribonuclease VII large subunit [Bacteroidales bacterium]MDD4821761.1 exodeoxyribonuclease VII large subunit [Bacteroidales bacterium]